MQNRTKNGIKKIFSITTAVWTAFVGLLFVIQVWRIFALGKRAFTPANIVAKFTQIAVPVYIWLLLVLASVVLSIVLPDEKRKPVATFLSMKANVNRLKLRLPQPKTETQELAQSIYAWKIKDILSWSVCGVVGVLCLTVAIAYVMGGFAPISAEGFFAEHQEAEFLLRALPWVFGALGAGIFAVYFHTFAQNKQIGLMKQMIAEDIRLGNKPVKREKQDYGIWSFTQQAWFLPTVRGIVGAVAITLIIVGICNGGMADVFKKAVRICTQCIGLG